MLQVHRATWTFGQLLNWHFERGTRPDGAPDSKGVPWQNKAFALAVGKESNEGPKSERTIRNWRNGQTSPSPSDFEAILRALFGGKPVYADWRGELTEKYHLVRVEDEPPQSKQETPPPSLPTKPLRCLGRDDDLRSVIEALVAERDDTAVLVLGGPGMGKTTVTRQAAVDPTVVAKFGQRRWFVELETATNAEALEKAIVIALGLDPAAARFEATLGRFGEAPGLLVLDNLETPWDGEREKVETLLTALHRVPSLVLLASIRGNDSPAGVRWTRRRTMHPLETPHDRALFIDIAADIKDNDPDLNPLLTLLGGVPIAIELVALLAAPHDTLHAIRAEWERVGVALAQRRGAEPSRLSSLEVSLELSFQSARLGDAGRRLFAILGQLPVGMAADDLSILLGDMAFEARQGLLASGLAFERGGRLDLLSPMRDHARRAHRPSDADTSLWRDYYLALARAGFERTGAVDGAAAIQRIAAELPNLDAAIWVSIGAENIVPAAGAAPGMANAMALTGLGTTATLDALAKHCRRASDPASEARVIDAIGYVALARSEDEVARKAYEQALPIYRRVGNTLGEANCIKSLGDIALARSDHDLAHKTYNQALVLYRQVGNILGEANCIRSLGDIALARSDHEAARQAYEHALPLYREIGNTLGEVNCIKSVGNIALACSDHETAREAYEQALQLYRRVGAIQGEANCIKSLGDIIRECSDPGAARKAYEEALSLYRQIGDVLGEAACNGGLRDIALRASDRKTHPHALAQYERIPEPYTFIFGHPALSTATDDIDSVSPRHRAG